MRFRTFMVIWLVLITSFAVMTNVLVTNNKFKSSEQTVPAHFSVVWKGFRPDYNNQTPDYYVCINDLAQSELQMNIALRIQNNENRSFWFMVDKYGTPPTGWTINPYYVGNINVDATLDFVYSNVTRQKPSSIPAGRADETIALVAKAYNDSSYSNFYSQANFTVNFHFIDRKASVWTQLYYYDFDDGTTQGWDDSWTLMNFKDHYRSWPYSVKSIDTKKTFDTSGPGSEAYIIFPLYLTWLDTCGVRVLINNVQCFQADVSSIANSTWYQFVVPIPLSSSVTVEISAYWFFMDSVYVIRK